MKILKLLFIAFFIITSLLLNVSAIDYGIKGGLNYSFINADKFTSSLNNYSLKYANDNAIGYHIGFFAKLNFSNIFFEPELLLTTNKNNMEIFDESEQETTSAEFRLNRLDIPLLAGINIQKLRVVAGPIASFILKTNSDIYELIGYNEKFKTATFGFQSGLGISVSNFIFDLKYEGNLSELGNKIEIENNSYNFDKRMSQLIFSVGIFF